MGDFDLAITQFGLPRCPHCGEYRQLEQLNGVVWRCDTCSKPFEIQKPPLRKLAVGVVLLLCAVLPVQAQIRQEPLAWNPEHQETANVLSNIAVGGQAFASGVKAYHDWQAGNHTTMWRTVCSGGVAGGAAFALKSFIHEERPNGIDNHSFPSGHSAVAASLSGWNFTFGVPVAAFVGMLRVNANWHHLYKDVMPGWAIGAGAQALCTSLIH